MKKIRIWDKQQKIWRKSPNLYKTFNIQSVSDHIKIHTIETEETIKDEDVIVQYFSGLNDSEHQEIYEGDIIEFSNEPGNLDQGDILRREVIFENGYFGWKRHLPGYKSIPHAILFPYALTCKVIGNIFENPDLLAD